MESWNHIVNTILLGTDKKVVRREELDSEFAEQFTIITDRVASKEEAFLHTAALVFNFRQCGFFPLHKEDISISKSPNEEKQYASAAAHTVLLDIVESGSISLLEFWLSQCAKQNKIVQPEWTPLLLSAGMKNKELHELCLQCCGNRGVWLSQFNPAWKYGVIITEDTDVWQVGTLDQRKKFLADLRKSEPAKGRELLKDMWPNENAATKAELLQQLMVNLGEEDLPWLEELKNDKSAKVKEAAVQLLKKIPSSSIVQLYWDILRGSMQLRKEKTMLGLSSKWILEVLPLKEIDENIYTTGIEKMSSEKNVSDQNFVLYQLAMSVPPSFFQQHFNLGMDDILKALDHGSLGKDLLPAFGQAAIQFNELDWLRKAISRNDSKFYAEAFQLLPQQEAEKYAIVQLERDDKAAEIIKHLASWQGEWSSQLAKKVLKYTSKNPYNYQKGFYENVASLLPISITAELESFSPDEAYLKTMWLNISDHITKLISLKRETINAFTEK